MPAAAEESVVAFREVEPEHDNDLAIMCPDCGAITHKRRDSVAIGLHWLVCLGGCGFETCDVIVREGDLVTREKADLA